MTHMMTGTPVRPQAGGRDAQQEPVSDAMADAEEEESVTEAAKLAPRLLYEVIRRDGEEELHRETPALIWSGIAAGMVISFSVVGEAVLRTSLPDQPWRAAVENWGYSLGFLIVILGRMQLFTENTITTVLPVLAAPSRASFGKLARLWGIVLAANMVGALVAAGFFSLEAALPPETRKAALELSHHATDLPAMTAFVRGIPAGILIAALVWLLPQTHGNAFPVIMVMTWLIAMGEFTHVIAGSVEMFLVIIEGTLPLHTGVMRFWLPVLFGNILGGTAVFTALAWAQVRAELRRGRAG